VSTGVFNRDVEPRAHHRPYRRLAVGVGSALVVVAVSWLLVNRPDVSPAEERLFRIVNNGWGGLWPVLWPVMQLGNIAAPVIVAGVSSVVLRRWRPAAAALVAGYGAWGAAQLIKGIALRDRPDVLLPAVLLREGADGLGFVSGHAAIAAALGAAVWPYLSGRGRAVVIVLTAMVAAGRVYAGAHLPLDVVGGAAIGVLIGLAAHALFGLPKHDRSDASATR
jgi:undecaprenyl-diphosphatase